MNFRTTLALASVLVASTQSVGAAEVNLAPHRAVYEMGLHKITGAGSVTAVTGRLVLEFTDVCDGYTLNQRIRTEMVSADGDVVSSDFAIASWESRDGKKFRFSLKHELTGEELEEHVGNAELTASGGRANMTKPEVETIDLPVGTVFPTEHLKKLIEAAQAGTTYLPVRVFDGSAEDGLFETGAYLGKQLSADAEANPAVAPLVGLKGWPVRIAYFPLIEKQETPRYEVQFRMFENGVSGDMILDYAEFAMKGKLVVLEMLPKPQC